GPVGSDQIAQRRRLLPDLIDKHSSPPQSLRTNTRTPEPLLLLPGALRRDAGHLGTAPVAPTILPGCLAVVAQKLPLERCATLQQLRGHGAQVVELRRCPGAGEEAVEDAPHSRPLVLATRVPKGSGEDGY